MECTHRMASPSASAVSFSFMAVSIAFLALPVLLFFFFVFFFLEDDEEEADAPPRTTQREGAVSLRVLAARELSGVMAETPHGIAPIDKSRNCVLDFMIMYRKNDKT